MKRLLVGMMVCSLAAAPAVWAQDETDASALDAQPAEDGELFVPTDEKSAQAPKIDTEEEDDVAVDLPTKTDDDNAIE